MTRALIIVVLACAAACGQNVDVGAVCTTRNDCAPALSCVTSAPGGFCSRGCSVEGDVNECGVNQICAFFGNSALVCSNPCTSTDQCRVNYECADVLGAGGKTTGKKACRPEGTTR